MDPKRPQLGDFLTAEDKEGGGKVVACYGVLGVALLFFALLCSALLIFDIASLCFALYGFAFFALF